MIMIEQAFKDVPGPPEGRLTASRDEEALDDTAPFEGKRWKDLDPAALDAYQYALFWFTPEAFHYYLPAFLSAGLEDPTAIYVITLLQILMPTNDEALARFRSERWRLLSGAQVEVIERWLCGLLEKAPPEGVFKDEVEQGLQVVRDRHWWTALQ